jgi:hypothetical protein
VLEGIHNNQGKSAGQALRHQLGEVCARLDDADGSRCFRRDERRIRHLAKGDEEDSSREVSLGTPSSFQGEARLAYATRPRQRQEPDSGTLKRGTDGLQLAYSTEERRWYQGQTPFEWNRWRTHFSATCESDETGAVIVHKPQRGGETLRRVLMDNISEAPLNVTYGAGADTGALCQLVLGQPGR